jgi:phage shock protein PspC (stress-responsive transcriptional regulator)
MLRNDTFLGVCEAIGRDFGFNPNWLRVLLAASLYWLPMQVVAAYLGLAVLVLLSRVIAPDHRATPAATALPGAAAEPEVQEQLPLAA